MGVECIREVLPGDAGALKGFVALERQVVGSHPFFYADADVDVSRQLSGKSAFFREMRYALFAAAKEGRDVARCAALINPRYQAARGEAAGFVGYFAAAADCQAQVRALLERAEAWLAERGVRRVVAPYNGSIFLGFVGLRTAAFDEEPCYPYGWHPPHYAAYLEACGYRPVYPMLSYVIDFSSPAYRAAVQRGLANDRVRVRALDKKEWDADLEIFRHLLNETFGDEWEQCPATRAEFREILDAMKPILDMHQALVAEVDGEPAGFCWGLPDWAPLLRSLKGKMGPLQIARLLLGAGRYRRAGLIMIGVLPEKRGKGVAQALAARLYQRYEEQGLAQALYHLVNESNAASRRLAESMGGQGRVLYHVYDKHLPGASA